MHCIRSLPLPTRERDEGEGRGDYVGRRSEGRRGRRGLVRSLSPFQPTLCLRGMTNSPNAQLTVTGAKFADRKEKKIYVQTGSAVHL